MVRTIDKEQFNRLYRVQGGRTALTGELMRGRRIVVHHDEQRRVGGGDRDENLKLVTLEEAAVIHLEEAGKSSTDADRRANLWAVQKSVDDMTPEELKRFNELLRQRGHTVKFY